MSRTVEEFFRSLSVADKHMNDYVVRMTFPEDYSECRITQCIQEIFRGYPVLVSREGGQIVRVHFHAYVSEVFAVRTLRSRLTKHLKGNQQFSCKRVTSPREQLQYVAKGEEFVPPVIVLNTFEGLDPDDLWKGFWKDRRDYKEAVQKNRKGKESFVDRLESVVREQKIFEDCEGVDLERSILMEALKICKQEGRLVPSEYHMVSYIRTVVMRLGGDMSVYVERIMEKLRNY